MHPAYSVILFTTASGAGYGLLALLGITGLMHGPVSSFTFGAMALAVSLLLITAGLLSSTLHLGHPERAWRAFSQWRSSWLSREGVAAVFTYLPALWFGAAWLQLLAISPAAPGILAALSAAVTVVCTAKIYSTLKTIRAWHQPLTVPVYLAFALATGAPLMMLLAAAFGRWQPAQAAIAAAAVVLAGVLKLLYWRAIDKAERTYSMAAATGLKGTVRQWEDPHTARNYVMTEMGYAVARRHGLKLRRLVLLLLTAAAGFIAGALLLPAAALPLALAASLAAFAAAVVERWLFFAEAQHVVTLYYGAARA